MNFLYEGLLETSEFPILNIIKDLLLTTPILIGWTNLILTESTRLKLNLWKALEIYKLKNSTSNE